MISLLTLLQGPFDCTHVIRDCSCLQLCEPCSFTGLPNVLCWTKCLVSVLSGARISLCSFSIPPATLKLCYSAGFFLQFYQYFHQYFLPHFLCWTVNLFTISSSSMAILFSNGLKCSLRKLILGLNWIQIRITNNWQKNSFSITTTYLLIIEYFSKPGIIFDTRQSKSEHSTSTFCISSSKQCFQKKTFSCLTDKDSSKCFYYNVIWLLQCIFLLIFLLLKLVPFSGSAKLLPLLKIADDENPVFYFFALFFELLPCLLTCKP